MEESNSNEINLLQLINLFFNWLKGLVQGVFVLLGYIVRLCFRHKLTMCIVLLFSVMAGQYLARLSARVYKAEAMAMLYGNSAPTVKEVCKQFENSLATNKLISLGTKLSLPDSVANNVVEIKTFYVIDYLKDGSADKIDFDNNHPLSDTLNVRMGDRIYLQLKTRNIAQLPQIQAAILNYFNTNSSMKIQFDSHRNELLQQIRICDIEMQRIDSLAKVNYFKDSDKQLKFDNNTLLLGQQEKQLFYKDLIRLQEIKSSAEVRLANFIQPVNLPSGFVVSPEPENGKYRYATLSVLFGFFVALLVAALIENAAKIRAFLNK